MLARPDVLVLAAGGILGEAWMSGLLAGLEDTTGWDLRECEVFVGTSAGSIVAARLAAGERPRRPRERPSDLAAGGGAAAADDPVLGRGSPLPGPGDEEPPGEAGGVLRRAARIGAWAATPLVAPALAVGARPGARVRALALSRVPDRGHALDALHADIDRLHPRFDGRLRVCCVDKGTGRRVVFGRPGQPRASVADAVVASCSIPWVFRPVRIGEREYVDGGVWSLTNLDTAPAGRGTEVLCLHPSAGPVTLASPMGAVRAAAAAGAEVEALALRSRGASVRVVGPDEDAAREMGAQFMDPRPAKAVHAVGYAQGVALGT